MAHSQPDPGTDTDGRVKPSAEGRRRRCGCNFVSRRNFTAFAGAAWPLGGAALPLLLRLLDPAVGIAGADSCIFFGAFALCLYAAGTWISQSISQGGMDAPKLSSMHNMVGLLYVLSVLLGPVLLLRLGWEQWRKRRAANAAPWEKADDT